MVHSSKILSGHYSIPLSEKSIQIPPCPSHPKSDAVYFCNDKKCGDKQSLCCNTCYGKFHQQHAVIPIKTRLDANQQKLTNILQTLYSTEVNVCVALDRANRCLQSVSKDDYGYKRMIATINRHFDTKKREALENLDSFVESNKEKMEREKQQIKFDLGWIREAKKEIEMALKKKEVLFAQRLIETGEAICSLDYSKEANLVPLSMPSLEYIIGSKTCASKPSMQSPRVVSTSQNAPPPVPPQEPSRGRSSYTSV